MNHDPSPFSLYNPAMLPADVLLSEFTARKKLLARLLKIIRANDPNEPPQHILIVGPRGMGKTTLLWAIVATIETKDEDLGAKWQPVPFDEESRRIGDLADFWLECIRQWETATESQVQISRVDQLLKNPSNSLEEDAKNEFLDLIRKSKKRAVLLIDNLNDVFASIHDNEALLRLRSVLMSESRIMIIGAATRWFGEVTNIDKPFYEFFRPFDLKPLGFEEMKDCLAGIAESRGDQTVLESLEEKPGSVEALHLLTGGNLRLIRTFYRLLNEGLDGELRLQLERLIDDYTPYQKANLDALSPQQQRVLDAIALNWNPCDVAKVAQTTRLPSNQVSAQIRALVKSGILSEAAAAGTKKKKAYYLTDRFSNIHYLMRHGRSGRLKMHWYIMTLRMLYDDQNFVDSTAKTIKLGKASHGFKKGEAAFLAYSALDNAGSEDARRMLLDGIVNLPELDETESEELCRKAVRDHPNDMYAHFKLGQLLGIELKQFEESRVHFIKAFELDPQKTGPLVSLGLVSAKLGEYSESEEYFYHALKLDPKLAIAWNCLGILQLNTLGNVAKAEGAFRKAIAIDAGFDLPWIELGHIYTNYLDQFDKAEQSYKEAIRLNSKSPLAWSELGYLYEGLGRYEEAKEAFRKALQFDPNDNWIWISLGNLLHNRFDQTEEAESAFRSAIENDPTDPKAWHNLGMLLEFIPDRNLDAEKAFRMAIELCPNEALPWNGLGSILSEIPGKAEEAEEAFKQAISLDSNYPMPWHNLGELLSRSTERYADAETAYRYAIDMDPDFVYPIVGLGNLLAAQKKYSEAERTYRLAIKLDPEWAWLWNLLGDILTDHLGCHNDAESAFRTAIRLDPDLPQPYSGLADVIDKLNGDTAEIKKESVHSILLAPDYGFAQEMIREHCFEDKNIIEDLLTDISMWCTKNPDANSALCFAVDAWFQFASLAGGEDALKLFEDQPDEVGIAFESVKDTLLALCDKDHLHSLAPERKLPILKFLERF